MKENEVNEIPMQVLAFIGDAVYSLKVREYLATKIHGKSGLLHKETIKYVSAKSQANVLKSISEELTQKEQELVRRGRNTYTASVPKHTELIDYKYSTAFESLIGYLYMMKDEKRLNTLLDLSIVTSEKLNVKKDD